MKKKTKKWLSVLLALTLVLSLTAQYVMAEAFDSAKTTGTITITNPKEGSTYTAYKVLSATAKNNDYEYTVTNDFAAQDFFKKTDWQAKLESLASGSNNFNETPNSVDQLAAQLAAYVKTQNMQGEEITANATTVELGYYLILESFNTTAYGPHVATKPILISVPEVKKLATGGKDYIYDRNINPKDTEVTFTKSVADNDVTSETVAQEYDFTLTASIPAYGVSQYNDQPTFTISDQLPAGLTFVEVKSAVASKDDGTTAILTDTQYGKPTTATNGQIEFDFSDEYFKNIKEYTTLTVTYTANLNSSAEVGTFTDADKPNINTATLTYSNSTTTTATITDQVTTYTGGVVLNKVNTAGDKLSGVTFELRKDSGDDSYNDTDDTKIYFLNAKTGGALVETITTGDPGTAGFYGLGEGTYFIKETGNTGGYVVPDDPIKLIVTFDATTKAFSYTVSGMGIGGDTGADTPTVTDGIGSFTMTNYREFELPETGGMGTILFTAGGIALIGLAAFLFLRSRRKGEE